jgi:hypothetical protein
MFLLSSLPELRSEMKGVITKWEADVENLQVSLF